MRDEQRELGKELMHRLSESGQMPLMSYGIHPSWLGVAVSQILAATGPAPILYAGHTLEDYDARSVLDGAPDIAEGKIQVLTEELLITAEFSARRVKTTAVPLRQVESISITRVDDVGNRSSVWPGRVAFEVTIAKTTVSFPASPVASQQQYAELPTALNAVLAAARKG